jgi:hypothetical protein
MDAMDETAKYTTLIEVFPRIFDTATVVSTISVITGTRLLLRILIVVPLDALLGSTRGTATLTGSLMAAGLYLFHLTLENREITAIKKVKGDLQRGQTSKAEKLLRKLRIVPRVGLFVISTILVLMIYSSHPW